MGGSSISSPARPSARHPDSNVTVEASAGRQRAILSGPRLRSDPRTTPLKGDLAARELAGQVFVPHFADPLLMRVGRSAPILAEPRDNARSVSQLLAGEGFALLDLTKGFGWGYCLHDHYVGYIAADALAPEAQASNHVVSARAALVFAEPDIKSAIIARHEMGSRLSCGEPSDDGRFLAVAGGGWVHKRHIDAVGSSPADAAELAMRLLGAPYLWGGRGGDGLDCSGLTQMVLGLTGIAVPRDCDQQQDVVGRALREDEPLERNDLVYFPGHVGIMGDADTLIHANAHWMQVTAEPLADVVLRQADGWDAVIARRTLRP